MKKTLLVTLMCAIGICINAMSFEPSLVPAWWSLKSDKPFVTPLDEVYAYFQLPVKIIGDQNVYVRCGDETVAESVETLVVNDKAATGWEGALVIRFDSQYLPKDRTYELVIPEGTVGYVKTYCDIQVVNMEVRTSFAVPGSLGEPEIYAGDQIRDSNTIVSISYPYETATVDDAAYQLYREGELIGQYAIDIINYAIPFCYIHPMYDEVIPFEQNVRYSLVLPAGSLRSIYRDDIVNEEVRIDFVGGYTDPSCPFSYVWCSWYTDHSDVMGEVTFTYDRPVVLTDEARVQLWEGPDCGTLVKEVTPWINTDVNCWLLVADFGGVPLTSENGYTLVIPDGALISTNETGVTSARSQLSVAGSAGIEAVTASQSQTSAPVYDMYGRKVQHLIPGSMYIRNGIKFIHR